MAKLALKLTAVEFDELDPILQGYYESRDDGSYILEGFSDTTALKNALQHERDARKEAKAKLAEFADVDVEEYRELKGAKEALERKELVKKGDFDALLAKQKAEHDKEVALRDQRIATLQSALRQERIGSRATAAILAAGGEPQLLLPVVESRAEMREIDGKDVVVIVGDDGEPRLAKEAKSMKDFLSIEGLVAELKEDPKFGGAFGGTGVSGGGTPSTQTRQSGDKPPAEVHTKGDMTAIAKHAEDIAAGRTKAVD